MYMSIHPSIHPSLHPSLYPSAALPLLLLSDLKFLPACFLSFLVSRRAGRRAGRGHFDFSLLFFVVTHNVFLLFPCSFAFVFFRLLLFRSVALLCHFLLRVCAVFFVFSLLAAVVVLSLLCCGAFFFLPLFFLSVCPSFCQGCACLGFPLFCLACLVSFLPSLSCFLPSLFLAWSFSRLALLGCFSCIISHFSSFFPLHI